MAQTAHQSAEEGGVLLVADHAPPESDIASLLDVHRHLQLLDLSDDERVGTGSLTDQKLRIDELLDLDYLHSEFIETLERWSRETLVDGQPFDDQFRHTTGDSVWWVGPGNQRHPFGGPLFPTMRTLFLLRAACDHVRPSRIVMTVGDRRLATVLHSFCLNSGHAFTFLPDSARPLKRPGALGRSLWTLGATLSLVMLPIWIVLRSLYAQWIAGTKAASHPDAPALVMTGWYPNHVRDDDTGRPHVWYWQRLANAVQERHPETSVRYLLHTTTFRFHGWKRVLRPIFTGWRRLRHIEGALPLTQTHRGLDAYLQGAVRQWQLMRRYRRFEASLQFESSFDFAGADCSCLLVVPLRNAVATIAKWSRNVAATASSLKAAGDVRGVLVHEEFYPKGMLTIAAARTLGLPTMGVQHGAIGPQHTVYMPPPSSITESPVPDWFASYGNYAAGILSEQGAYSRERIVVVGASRFDELANSAPDTSSARCRLGWSETTPVILLTTETFALSGPIVRELIAFAREHPNWHIVCKLHPHDRQPEAYRQLLTPAGTPNVELCRDRLQERLAGCDVLVTGYSTTAMEGLLLGKRVVCADFTTTPPRYPYVEAGAALAARSPVELRSSLETALHLPLDDEKRREFLRNHLGPTVEGNGATHFASLISEMFLSPTTEPQNKQKA